MLARASFDQASAVNFALSHAGLLRATGRLPFRPLHKALKALTWLETWLRWPLRTLNIRDMIEETFALLDPDGQRLGLTDEARSRFCQAILYNEIPDLVVLLSHLERNDFRRQALVVEREEALLRERERGTGAIVVGFRIGPYPALPWVLASRGFRVSMIVGGGPLVEMGGELGEKFLPRASERIRFISAQDPRALALCLDDLNAGGLACTLLELTPLKYEKTMAVQFLGWEVQVPYGIAYLAAATGRSIIPAALTREKGPRFRLRLGEPLPPPTRDPASIRETMQQLYGALEQRVRRFPDQWIGWTLLGSHMGIDLETAPEATVPTLI